ncbi:MAG: PAS domain S-box protein [Cyanobacteria bacterium J06588_5]
MGSVWMQEILSPSRFIPHGHCYLWEPGLVWLHLLSDVLIAIAYFSIPITLFYIIRKREDAPFRSIFFLFGLFIVSCGTTHLMSVWTLWHPAYWLAGVIKALTAVVSVYTALTLVVIIPEAISLPSTEQMRQVNQRLETEIEERTQAEATLRYQLAFDQLIAQTSARFVNLAPEKIDREINRALQEIGEFVEVDTSHVFRFDSATNTMSMRQEWVAASQLPQIEKAQNIPQQAFPWAVNILAKGGVLQVPSVVALPTVAAMDQAGWQRFNLQSLIAIPVNFEGCIQGFIGFASFSEDKVWSERSVRLLKVFAEILARALQQAQAEIALKESENRLQIALEASKTSYWEQNLTAGEMQGVGWLADGDWQPTVWKIDIASSMETVHPEDKDWVQQKISDAIAAKGSFSLEYRLTGSVQNSQGNPQKRWVLTKGKIITDASGEATRIAGLTVDITERRQVEASWKDSEDRWQLALSGTNDGIWDWNLETNELFVSPRFKQMLGYQDYEFPDGLDSWASWIHPDDIDRVLAASLAHRQQTTPFYTAEYRILHKEGHYMWVLDRAKALRDDTGKAIRMTGSLSDIDARKRAEAALKQLNQDLERRVEDRTSAVKKSEQRFRSLFESAPDFVYVLNEQGVIQQINSTVTCSSGYDASDMIGQPLIAFLTPETQSVYQAAFDHLPISGTHRQEMGFVCKDGSVLTMDCSCNVVENDNSENYILVLQRDVTERQKIERERTELLATLQESERRWVSFLENVQLMVVGLDASGQVEYVNPCFVNQMSCATDDIVGQNWFESALPDAQRQHSKQAFEDIIHSGSHPTYQNSLRACSGDERLISWNTTLLKDTQGNPVGTLSIGEDITERHAVDRMKNEFISVVSHELRTPLTAIHGALDLLATGLVDPQSDRGQHVFGLAVENSDRLVKLVNDILELERLESGKIKLHKTLVSTKELIHRLCELLELVAERAGITLETSEIDLLLTADCDRLIQVLTNLVGNAIKFSEAPSTILVSVDKTIQGDTEAIKFTVADQGRGIPKDKVSRVFERFHQVDASDSRSKGGTGLGLAICQSIVQQHDGDIWVESTLGEGSKFMFTIPMQ